MFWTRNTYFDFFSPMKKILDLENSREIKIFVSNTQIWLHTKAKET